MIKRQIPHERSLRAFAESEAKLICDLNLPSNKLYECLELLDETVQYYNEEDKSEIFKSFYFNKEYFDMIMHSLTCRKLLHYFIMTERIFDMRFINFNKFNLNQDADCTNLLEYQIALCEIHSEHYGSFIEAWRNNHNAHYSYAPHNIIRAYKFILNREPTEKEIKYYA